MLRISWGLLPHHVLPCARLVEAQHTCRGILICTQSHLDTHTAHPTLGADSQLPSLLQGVIEFSLCLLFAKLVSYTFLFWLPLYITNVGECWLEVRFQSLH